MNEHHGTKPEQQVGAIVALLTAVAVLLALNLIGSSVASESCNAASM